MLYTKGVNNFFILKGLLFFYKFYLQVYTVLYVIIVCDTGPASTRHRPSLPTLNYVRLPCTAFHQDSCRPAVGGYGVPGCQPGGTAACP